MAHSYETRILRVLSYIHDNPAGDMSLDRLAEVAAMSRFHWHRVFHAMTGETCAQAVRRVRMHLAATWLVQGDQPIEHISAACGYSSVASFSHAFCELYGQRPAAFRKAGRLLPPLSSPQPGEFAMHPVTIRTEPARRLAALRHVGPFHTIGKSFESFVAICSARDLWPQIGPMIGVSLDDPAEVPPEKLNSLAGAEWRGGDIPDEMEEFLLPGGRAAVVTYKGPYAGVSSAYETLFGDWLPRSGETPKHAPSYHIALNSPRNTAPEDLVTEICLLLT